MVNDTKLITKTPGYYPSKRREQKSNNRKISIGVVVEGGTCSPPALKCSRGAAAIARMFLFHVPLLQHDQP